MVTESNHSTNKITKPFKERHEYKLKKEEKRNERLRVVEGGWLMENVWLLIRFILSLSDAYSPVAVISSILKLGSWWHKNDFEKRRVGCPGPKRRVWSFLVLLSERLRRSDTNCGKRLRIRKIVWNHRGRNNRSPG